VHANFSWVEDTFSRRRHAQQALQDLTRKRGVKKTTPMHFISGNEPGGLLILHGGAPSRRPEADKMALTNAALLRFAQECVAQLAGGAPCDVVVEALKHMESDPLFNAGLGSSIQSDRKVRVSAAVMDGTRQSFSGVINALDIKHPAVIAGWLQGQKSRVVSQPGVQVLARQLNLPTEDLITPAKLAEWEKRNAEGGSDTVGCVVRTAAGAMAAGTSTGGRAFELPGRVSDSATVAGTYASAAAAVSTTGIGEEIVDDALAARLETRCRDGMSLESAARRCFDEAVARGRSYGWIALDRTGEWVVAHTTEWMSFVVRNASGVLASSAAPPG
jgi:L-asparaginase